MNVFISEYGVIYSVGTHGYFEHVNNEGSKIIVQHMDCEP